MATWALRWVEHQLAWLEKGRRFSGRVASDDAAMMEAMLFWGSATLAEDVAAMGRGKGVDADIERTIAALKPGIPSLLVAAVYSTGLSDASRREQLARLDPAGFAAACLEAYLARPKR